MLLEFKTKNYKSFVDEMVFSMKPAPKKGLDYSIQEERYANSTVKGLCSAVIYGPNASGKTNIIGAMDTMRSIVLHGNIKNVDPPVSPNPASNNLELIPNRDDGMGPTCFSIEFVEQGVLIKYSFELDLGGFLNADYARTILKEELSVDGKKVFDRGETISIKIPSVIKPFINKQSSRLAAVELSIMENSLNPGELFLCNGFKTVISQKLVSLITEWFENKFMVIYRADAMQLIKKFSSPKGNTVYVEQTVNDAAKVFGVNSNSLGFRKSAEGDDAVLCSVFEDKNVTIPAEAFESYGTVRFVNEFPLVLNAMKNGGTLVIDEFDASIHPMALMNIINIFHNDEINRNHAQLIFNTHNPIFLRADLFRRDEIKFVERDEKKHSIHYALSDFKTTEGVRNGEDYMTNYFVSKYGAINDIDFSDIVEKAIEKNEVENDG